ncbi:MAG: acetyl esterase/lipase [Saprospiraceae bacterium]|jgi:acetyl esterase/lipase
MNPLLITFLAILAFGLIWYRKAALDMLNLIPFWMRMWKVKMHLTSEKYPFGKHKRQYLLYCPADKKVKERDYVILYYHGGGWQFSSPEAFIPAAQVLSDWGFPVIMASHRRLPIHGYASMREDISLALEKTWEIMQEKGLTDKKIILGGMSSGGNLAALLYFDKKALVNLNVPREKLSAIFLQSAPLDLLQMKWSPTILLFAGRKSSSTFAAASPITHLQATDSRPIYLIHGDKDGVVQYECTLSFLEKTKALRFPNIRFETVHGGGHMASSDWATVDNDVRKKLEDWLSQFS